MNKKKEKDLPLPISCEFLMTVSDFGTCEGWQGNALELFLAICSNIWMMKLDGGTPLEISVKTKTKGLANQPSNADIVFLGIAHHQKKF